MKRNPPAEMRAGTPTISWRTRLVRSTLSCCILRPRKTTSGSTRPTRLGCPSAQPVTQRHTQGQYHARPRKRVAPYDEASFMSVPDTTLHTRRGLAAYAAYAAYTACEYGVAPSTRVGREQTGV
eukprot:2621596-Rhodomonas_salina.5